MSESKKRSRTTIAIGVCIVIILGLVGVNAWQQFLVTNLSSQVNQLQTQNDALQNQLSSLQNQLNNLENALHSLESEVKQLQTQNNNLQNQVNNLEKPSLAAYFVDKYYTQSTTGFHNVSGYIINFGTKKAYNVRITFKWIINVQVDNRWVQQEANLITSPVTIAERSLSFLEWIFEVEGNGPFSYTWTNTENP